MFVIILLLFAVVLLVVRLLTPTKRNQRNQQNKHPYKSLQEVQQALRRAGLETSQLILGVDFTASNEESGRLTFHPTRSMHYIDPDGVDKNHYEQVIAAIGRTLEPFDEDKLIPCFGFGDATTKNQSVFPFWPDDSRSAYGFEEALSRYRELAPHIVMSGPTNFAPIIDKAIAICHSSHEYHILLIVCDGQVTNVAETRAAIVRASQTAALSIVICGVGDGPWDEMHTLDDGMDDTRHIDNVQFVEFAKYRDDDAAFATEALMELPAQFTAFKDANML